MNNTKDILNRFLGEPLKNIMHSMYDDYVEANVEFRTRSGMKTLIIRRELSKCCDWCRDLAGIYDYDSAPREVYQRHDSCRCMVTFRNEEGRYEDVWSKQKYDSQRDARIARIEEIYKQSNKLDNISKLKLKAKSDGRSFVDTTDLRFKQNKGQGRVTENKDFYLHDRKKLLVDGKNVVYEPSKEELKTAELLAKELGLNVEVLPRVNEPEGVKSPDYLLNGIKADRKGPSGSGKQTIFNQIKEIKGQSNVMVMDISNTGLTEARIRADLEKAFSYKSCNHLDAVIVIKNEKVLFILERA